MEITIWYDSWFVRSCTESAFPRLYQLVEQLFNDLQLEAEACCPLILYEIHFVKGLS
jgi:hypothetical protein